MSGPRRDDGQIVNAAARERQVADEIERFVAHWLIGGAHRRHRSLFREYHAVVQRCPPREPASAKLIGFLAEAKGPRRRDLSEIRLRGKAKR